MRCLIPQQRALVAAVAVACVALRANADRPAFSFQWNGPDGGSWAQATNWQGGDPVNYPLAYPGSDPPVLDSASSNQAIARTSLDAAVHINSLSGFGASWTVADGGGQFTGGLSALQLAAGVLSIEAGISGGASLYATDGATLFMKGNLTGIGDVTLSGAGQVNVTGLTNVFGTLTTNGAQATLAGLVGANVAQIQVNGQTDLELGFSYAGQIKVGQAAGASGLLTVNEDTLLSTMPGGNDVIQGQIVFGNNVQYLRHDSITLEDEGGIGGQAGINRFAGNITLNGFFPGSALGARHNFTVDPGGTLTLSGSIFESFGKMNGLNKEGDGTLVLSGFNSFTGAMFIDAGTLSFSDAANLGGAGVTNVIQLNEATLQCTGITNLAREIQPTTMLSNIEVTAGSVLTLTGPMLGTALIKTGPGILRMNHAAQNFAVGVYIDEGTLQCGVFNALPASSVVHLGNGPTDGVLDLNGNALTIAGLVADGAGGGNLATNSLAGPTMILTIANGIDQVCDARVEGNLSFYKDGPGTLTVAAPPKLYVGDTVARTGTMNEIRDGQRPADRDEPRGRVRCADRDVRPQRLQPGSRRALHQRPAGNAGFRDQLELHARDADGQQRN
ncbi:MAG: autotransporter-associated beta strand repeat-containing protein [Tepidisphaerales bacterium]